jgi:hypothetical protein
MLASNPTTTEAIIATLGNLTQKDPSISLTKHHKGITLSDDIQVVDIQPDCATIQASRREIFPCLKGEVHLHSQKFSGSFSGRIHPIDFSQGTFLLSDLAYEDWKERSFERVQPKESIYVNLHHDKGSFRVFLRDISVNGMGILGYKTIDPSNQLGVGEKVMLGFQLSGGEPLLVLAGKLVYRRKISWEMVQFGIMLFPNADQQDTLEQFISDRRNDILDEIDQTYIRSFEPYRVENLYF